MPIIDIDVSNVLKFGTVKRYIWKQISKKLLDQVMSRLASGKNDDF